MAVIPLTYILAIPGKYPVFLHPEFPSGHTLSATRVAEGLMAGNTWCLWAWQQHSLSTPSSSAGAQTSHAKSLQSYPTLCDPIDSIPPAPLSMGFSRQQSWSGFPFPPPGDLPNLRIEPQSLTLAGRLFTASAWEALRLHKEPY